MMRRLIYLLPLFLFMCTPKQVLDEQPLQYSFMPRYLALDSIQPLADQDTSAVVDSTYSDFKSIALDAGVLLTAYGDTVDIPAGILISERKAALSIFYEAAWPRYVTETRYREYLMRTYHDNAIAAEALYQDEIKRLKKENSRTWLEKNASYIGFGSALVFMVLRDWVFTQAVK